MTKIHIKADKIYAWCRFKLKPSSNLILTDIFEEVTCENCLRIYWSYNICMELNFPERTKS